MLSAHSVCAKTGVTKDLPVIFAKRVGVRTLTSQAACHEAQ